MNRRGDGNMLWIIITAILAIMILAVYLLGGFPKIIAVFKGTTDVGENTCTVVGGGECKENVNGAEAKCPDGKRPVTNLQCAKKVEKLDDGTEKTTTYTCCVPYQ